MKVEYNNSDFYILVVDDIPSNLLLLSVQLSKEKYNIGTALSAEEALNMIECQMPDLIILDIMMPRMDGFEMARRVKAMPEPYSDIPIIFLTALDETESIVKGFEVGGSDYITKAFNNDEMLMRVKHQISLVAAKRVIAQKTEDLRNSILSRDKLYSVIAHDLRSPMGSIKMMLNMLVVAVDHEQIGGDMYEMLSMVNKSVEDTFTLLDNLLKWSKSQIGRLNVVRQNMDMVVLCRGLIEVFEKMGEFKQIRFSLDAPESCDVYVDRDMIKSVLRNLLSNSLKFSNKGGEIILHVKDSVLEEGGFAVISVEDFGCGISEEGQSKLLKLESHFSTFGTGNEEGSGLGLLLCLDFVTKNSGRLWLTSQKGVGTTFNFSLPKE